MRQPLLALHACPQHEHAGAIAGRVEAEGESQEAPRKGVREEGRPGASEVAPGARADQLDIELGVVDVADLERPIPMARGGWRQFPVEGGNLGSGAWSLPFGHLLLTGPTPDRPGEGLVAGHRDPLRVARAHQRGVHRKPRLLLEGFVIGRDEGVEERQGRRGQLPRPVPALMVLREKTHVAAGMDLLGVPPARKPVPHRAG